MGLSFMTLARLTITVSGEDEKEKTTYSIPLSFIRELSDDALGLMVRMTLDEHEKRFTAAGDP
jgi:hypothetical protein